MSRDRERNALGNGLERLDLTSFQRCIEQCSLEYSKTRKTCAWTRARRKRGSIRPWRHNLRLYNCGEPQKYQGPPPWRASKLLLGLSGRVLVLKSGRTLLLLRPLPLG